MPRIPALKKSLLFGILFCTAFSDAYYLENYKPSRPESFDGISSKLFTDWFSPPRQLLIVNANLAETFRRPDVADPTDMENFVHRLLEIIPYEFTPDVLLLQEVRRTSAQNVADFMTEATGFEYIVAVDPGPTPFLGGGHRRDNAIIVNTHSMRIKNRGGFQRSSPNRKGRTKDHAYTLLEEKKGEIQLAAVSVHYAHHGDTGKWVQKTASFLEKTYPTSTKQVEVIGGDFNRNRCREMFWKEEQISCKQHSWYNTLTQAIGYTDAIYATGKKDEILHPESARIDYIFARAEVIDAGSDLEATKGKDCKNLYNITAWGSKANGPCSDWYSDHRFNWALITIRNK